MNALKTLAKPASSRPARLFTTLAVAGVATTIALTSKAAIRADRRLKDIEKEDAASDVKIVEVWDIYVPAGIAATVTICCILKASRLQRFRSEALLTAFIVEPFVNAESLNG
jgi:hypothetical protein